MEQLYENLSEKQQKALIALMQEPSITRAIEKSDVGRSTMYRWLKDPAFAAARRGMLNEALSNATARLKAEAEASVQTLAELRDSRETPPTARLGAASKLLEYAFRADVYEDILVMIEDLKADE